MPTAIHETTTPIPDAPRSFVWPAPTHVKGKPVPQTPPTPVNEGRRGLLGFSLATLAAALTAGLSLPAQTDPALDLYDRYRRTEAEQDQIKPRADIVRSCLTAKWGTLPTAYLAWAEDPDSAELTRLNKISDDCTARLCDITDELMVTPASSLAGLRAKLEIAIELWPTTEGELHEDVALAFMRDAVRLLGVSANA